MTAKMKFVVIGEATVGKTAFLLRLVNGTFTANTMPTVGLEFKSRKQNILGREWSVEIWDTTGQERFRKVVSQFFKGIQGAFIVFDLTNEKSFEMISYWLAELNNNVDQSTPKILLGNKYDLLQSQISMDLQKKIQQVCTTHGMQFFETSAKTGKNVEESYKTMIDEAYKRTPRLPTVTVKPMSLIVPKEPEEIKKKSCC